MSGLFLTAEDAKQQLSRYMLQNGKIRTCAFDKKCKPNKVRILFDNMNRRVKADSVESLSYANVSIKDNLDDFQIFADFILSKFDVDFIVKNKLQMDKDLLGMAVPDQFSCYSKSTITFIPCELNYFLAFSRESKPLPSGVMFDKNCQKYQAYISVGGKKKHLGLFCSAEQASEVYSLEKHKQALQWADAVELINPFAAAALRSLSPKNFAGDRILRGEKS